jgi:hypothetical protein
MKLEDTAGLKTLDYLEQKILTGTTRPQRTLVLLSGQVAALFQIAGQLEPLRAELRGEK